MSTSLELKIQQRQKDSWIKNVVRIQQISKEEAEKLYNKIYGALV